MGARHIVDIITDNYGSTGEGGDTPTKINKANFGQGDYYRFEWFDESILIFRPSKEFLGMGVEQYYEKNVESFEIEIATVEGTSRYDIIEAEVRRLCLNFHGNSYYSKVHLTSIQDIEHHYYAVGRGIITGTLNLSHANS